MEHNHNDSHHHGVISKLKNYALTFESWLVPIFAKLPHLPPIAKKVVADIAPWISLILGVLGIIGLLGAGRLGVLISPLLALNKGLLGITLYITIGLGLISSFFLLFAFNPLQEMKKVGWNFAFYSLIIYLISAALSMIAMFGGLGDLIGIVILAYGIFEVRESYN
jgi:hypothetical protein